MSNDDLLIAQEVASLLRIKAVTVYAAAADGRIPSITLWKGRRRPLIRFRRQDIERILAERARPSKLERS